MRRVSTTRWMWHIEECVRWVGTTRCLAECDTLRSVRGHSDIKTCFLMRKSHDKRSVAERYCQGWAKSVWHCVIAWERRGFVHSVLDYVSSDGFLVPNCVQFTSLTLQVLPLYFVVISCWLFLFEDVPLVEFTYLIFTRMPGESYHRRLRSLLLYLCYVFWVQINSLACWFCFCFSFVFGKSCVCTLLLFVDF